MTDLCISLLIVVFHKPLVSLFTDNPEIILLSVGIFLVDIVTEQARAISHVYEQALRAAGDVLITMIVVLVSCWTFGVGLSYILSITCNMGLIGCWIGIALDESVREIFTYFRWRSQKWKKKLKSSFFFCFEIVKLFRNRHFIFTRFLVYISYA